MSKKIVEKTTDELEDARKRISEITTEMVALFCERQSCMRKIATAKKNAGDKFSSMAIYLPEREQKLLDIHRETAHKHDVDPEMVDMLVSILMSAGKFEQQKILSRATLMDTEKPSTAQLKENLLELTEQIANSYYNYDSDTTAVSTSIEHAREVVLLNKLLLSRKPGGTAINIGCADGSHITKILQPNFDHIVGYDISPHMVAAAKKRYSDTEFHEHDLNSGIPVPDNSVNLIVANLGTASQLYTDEFWSELSRVLKQDGRAFLSFYNKDALTAKWWTPWNTTSRATVNPLNDTVLVPFQDATQTRVYPLYAHSVTSHEVQAETYHHNFEITDMESSSPLFDDKPVKFFEYKEAIKSVQQYDKNHRTIPPFIGQYIRVVVRKK